MGKNPQIALNQFVIHHIGNKSLFKESNLAKVLKAAGTCCKAKQNFFIQNSKFFRQEPITLYEHGAV